MYVPFSPRTWCAALQIKFGKKKTALSGRFLVLSDFDNPSGAVEGFFGCAWVCGRTAFNSLAIFHQNSLDFVLWAKSSENSVPIFFNACNADNAEIILSLRSYFFVRHSFCRASDEPGDFCKP